MITLPVMTDTTTEHDLTPAVSEELFSRLDQLVSVILNDVRGQRRSDHEFDLSVLRDAAELHKTLQTGNAAQIADLLADVAVARVLRGIVGEQEIIEAQYYRSPGDGIGITHEGLRSFLAYVSRTAQASRNR